MAPMDIKNKIPLINNIIAASQKGNYEIFIVGGIIRDILLGQVAYDIDIAIKGDLKKFAHEFNSMRSSSHFFNYNNVFQMWRIIFKNSIIVDISSIATNIEDDLSLRDFTINAMAYNPLKNELLDPFDG